MEDLKFQKLTPTQNVDLSGYEEAFDFIFSNADIKNIAISGPFSSGKSSVIESYKKTNPKLKFIHLSLAHFQALDELTGTAEAIDYSKDDTQSNDHESVIEGKILNQLIQQIPAGQIPLTNFRIKRSTGWLRPIISSVCICAFITMFLHCIRFDSWVSIVNNLGDSNLKRMLIYTTLPKSHIVGIAGMIILVGIILYMIIKMQYFRQVLHKINIQGNEIEIFAEEKDSYFDKYLNEVLYLFENTYADGVVFEDIDRFNNPVIFERLREINTLTNIRLSEKKGCRVKKPLRFFYLLRDDIFENKDRTKFFDFILPIVPVLDSSNSYNKIKEYMEVAGVYDLFDDHFLRGISLYIDDLRIVKNIFNEYLVYNKKLNKIELDVNKLFAIIVYKNVFPKDFADLQLNKGFVHTLFESKEKLITEKIASVQSEISSIEERIACCEKEHLESEKELNYVKDGREKEAAYNWQKRGEFQEWCDNTYPRRKQAIEDKRVFGVSKLTVDLQRKREEVEDIVNSSFSSLLNRENIDNAFRVDYVNEIEQVEHFYEIKANPYFTLLKYLISRGYIDESYSDYMTFFYPNSLSLNDKVFLRSVADRIGKQASYHLDSPQLVTNNLNNYDFSQKETLNYDLFEYILTASKNDFVQTMIAQIETDQRFDFISAYMDSGKDIDQMVIAINTYWPTMLYDALRLEKLSDEHIKLFSYRTLINSDSDVLSRVNANGWLAVYISNDPKYLWIEDVEVEKLGQALSELLIEFEKIEISGVNIELFEYVYKHNLYSINESNIRLMLNTECEVQDVSVILPVLFTFILNHREYPLCRYLWDYNYGIEICSTFNAYFDMFKGGIKDTSETITVILNTKSISQEIKEKYIGRLETYIESIDKIKDFNILKMVISHQKALYSPENILYYFEKFGLDDDLISFINSNPDVLDYLNNSEVEILEKFLDACIIAESIDNEKYSQIMENICDQMQSFNVKGIKDDKLNILINLGLIEMNLENLEFMRRSYPDAVMLFINRNLKDYISTVTVNGFDLDETKRILEWKGVSDQEKIKLLKQTNKPIEIQNKRFGDDLLVYILNNNFSETDIPWILSKYSEFSSKVKGPIQQIACCRIERFLPGYSDIIDDALIDLLFKSDNIGFGTKIRLLGDNATKMSKDKLCTLLNYIGADKISNNLCDGVRRVDVTSENEQILRTLLTAGVIQKYSLAADGHHYKRIKYCGV